MSDLAPSTIETLQDELLLEILGFLSFRDLCRFRQVTRRMWLLSQDKDFWKKIKICASALPGNLMQDIMIFDVKYLSIPCCTIKPMNPSFLEGHESNLIHLNIACCDGNDELLSDLVAASKSLKMLDLSMSKNKLVSMCVEKIPMENTLTAINLGLMGTRVVANELNRLDFNSIKLVVDKCRNLTDLVLHDTHLSFQSIAYVCNNLTNKMLRLDFCSERVMDDNVIALANQCKNLEYLNLSDTWVSLSVLSEIVQAWSGTLMDLSLPQEIGLDIGLDEDDTDETNLESLKAMIGSLQKLKYLHIGTWLGNLLPFDIRGIVYVEKKKHIEKLKKLLPGLTINLNPFSENSPAKTNPSYQIMKMEEGYIEY